MDYNKIKLLSKNVVNVKACSDMAIPQDTSVILESATAALSGNAKVIFKSLVDTGGIAIVSKKLGNAGLSAMGNMDESAHSVLTTIMSKDPKLLSMLAGINILNTLLAGDSNKAATCNLIKTHKSKLESLSQINSNLRSKLKLNPSILNGDTTVINGLVKLSNYEFLKLNGITTNEKTAIDSLLSTSEFNFFNDSQSLSLSNLSDMPLSTIYANQELASVLTLLDDESKSIILNYLSTYTNQQFDDLLNMLALFSDGDHLVTAQYADIIAMSGLIGVQIDLGQLTSDMQPVIMIFSQVPNDIRTNILSLNKTVFSGLSVNFDNTETRQLISMSPNTWDWFYNYQVDNSQSLWSGNMALTKSLLSYLTAIDYVYLTAYNEVRTTTDTTNLLGVFDMLTIAEICDQRLYRDLSIFSDFGDMDICQAFLDYGNGRFTIDDNTLQDYSALSTLLGVSESIFTGTNWLAVKSMCKLSTVNLTKINSNSNVNNIHSLSLYTLSTLRELSASSAGDYISTLTNTNLTNVYNMLYKPITSVPSSVLSISAAVDLLSLSDDLFGSWQNIFNIGQPAILSLSSQLVDSQYTSLITFFNLVDVTDLTLISALDDTTYSNFKTITKSQYDAIYNLLDLNVESLNDLLDTPTHINTYIGTLSTATNSLLLALYKLREAFSELLIIDQNSLLSLFSITDNNSLILYLKFIEYCDNASISNYVGLNYVFNVLSFMDDKYRTLVIPSQYLDFIKLFTLEQLQYMDQSAVNALVDNNLYDVINSTLFARITVLTDSEIDSLGELSDSIIDILISDFFIMSNISLYDYSDFSIVNGGPFTDDQISKFKIIMEG